MIDTKKLSEGLKKLSGNDFISAEREERQIGNTASNMNYSSAFQARLAAKALNIPVEDVTELSIHEFATVTNEVFNFLFVGSATEIVEEQSKD